MEVEVRNPQREAALQLLLQQVSTLLQLLRVTGAHVHKVRSVRQDQVAWEVLMRIITTINITFIATLLKRLLLKINVTFIIIVQL